MRWVANRSFRTSRLSRRVASSSPAMYLSSLQIWCELLPRESHQSEASQIPLPGSPWIPWISLPHVPLHQILATDAIKFTMFSNRKAIEPLTGPSTRLAPRLTSRPWTPAKHQNTKHPKSASTASTTALRVRQPEANLSGPTASIIHQKIPSDHGKKNFCPFKLRGFIVFPLWKPRIYEMLNATYSTINLPYLQLISADYLLGSQPRAPGVDRTAGVPQIYPKTPSDCVWK